MPQESNEPAPSYDVHAYLHAIATLLRQPQHLDAAAQAALADLVDELDRALRGGSIPNDEAARVAAMATQFAEAVHREDEPGVLQAARDRLDAAALAVESQAPMVAGLARRFIDALSNIGI